MQPWAHGQQVPQNMYDRYGAYTMPQGGYPNATASGSPMNYGAYYPPATYAPSHGYNTASTGPAYRGGYQGATSYGNAHAYTSTASPSYGQYNTNTAASAYPAATGGYSNAYSAGSYNPGVMANATSGASAGQGGYTATTGASQSSGYDAAFITALHNLSFGNK